MEVEVEVVHVRKFASMRCLSPLGSTEVVLIAWIAKLLLCPRCCKRLPTGWSAGAAHRRERVYREYIGRL